MTTTHTCSGYAGYSALDEQEAVKRAIDSHYQEEQKVSSAQYRIAELFSIGSAWPSESYYIAVIVGDVNRRSIGCIEEDTLEILFIHCCEQIKENKYSGTYTIHIGHMHLWWLQRLVNQSLNYLRQDRPYTPFTGESTVENGSYVYTLRYPDGITPFYVGKGIGERLHQHVAEFRNNPTNSTKHRVIGDILQAGLQVIEHKEVERLSDTQALNVEEILIRHLTQSGLLTNASRAYAWSEEKHLRKLAEHLGSAF